MLFVLKMTYLIMPACAEPCCADLPDSPTFAKPCYADSPNSPTFAEPCCADSPNSPTFAKPFTEYSPDSPTFAKRHFGEKCDSPRHIRTSNLPFSRIWGKWPLLRYGTPFRDRSFFWISFQNTFTNQWNSKEKIIFEGTLFEIMTSSPPLGFYCIFVNKFL